MSKQRGHFFGKSGKVYGPFSDTEFEAFQTSGKINEYSYLWSHEKRTWMPIDLPPAPLTFDDMSSSSAQSSAPTHSASVTSSAHSVPAQQSRPLPSFNYESLLAIAHTENHAISARLQNVTQTGCELLSSDSKAISHFSENLNFKLNLIEPKSNQMKSVSAKVLSRVFKDGAALFQIRWSEAPEFS